LSQNSEGDKQFVSWLHPILPISTVAKEELSSNPPACSQVVLSIKILKWARRKEAQETGC